VIVDGSPGAVLVIILVPVPVLMPMPVVERAMVPGVEGSKPGFELPEWKPDPDGKG
jgi:hypothetical protein